MKVLPRIAQYDLVESIKNTNVEACSDDLSSDRLSSFILRLLKCTVRVFSFRSAKFALPFFPSNVSVCFRGLIARFGAAPPNQ